MTWCRMLCACGCGQPCSCDAMARPEYAALVARCRYQFDADGAVERTVEADRMPRLHVELVGHPIAAHHPAPSVVPCTLEGCDLALGHRVPHQPDLRS